MTDKTREEIAEIITRLRSVSCSIKGYEEELLINEVAKEVSAIPEIKEGQELLEKAKSGKLVELDRDQSCPDVLRVPGLTGAARRVSLQLATQENMVLAGFRRVKGVKG